MARRHTLALIGALLTGVLAAPSAWAQSSEADGSAEFEVVMALLQRDPVAGVARIETMAAGGDAEALNLLATVLSDPPPGVGADPVRAEGLYRRAIAGGSDAARLNFGTALLLNDDPADDVEAVAMLNAITHERLRLQTAYPLGRSLIFGQGRPRDLALGSALMIQAADLSPENLDAQFLAGRALQNGWGIAADPTRARTYLRRAADGGDARAQWNLGMLLLEGQGGPADPAGAYAYVRRAAEAGYDQGQISIAVMLARGQGVAPDPAQARQWYDRAAEQGSAHAMRGLGMMLIVGEGGAADPARGAALLELAAEAGDTVAQDLRTRFATELAGIDRAAVESHKAAWLAAHGGRSRPSGT